jgi:RNA polymerase sigma-70 factor, ECF subfamily
VLIVRGGFRIRRVGLRVEEACRALVRRARLVPLTSWRYGRWRWIWQEPIEPVGIRRPNRASDLSQMVVGQLRREATLSATAGSDLNTLLRRCAEGDHRALRALYDDQARRLYGIAYRICHQPAEAADAVHDTFLNVWQFAARFDPGRGSAEAWLTSIVRYRALDIARRSAREVTGLETPEPEDEEPNALSKLEGAADAEALRHCLEQLDEDKRRLVMLAFLNGFSHSELARRLRIPLGTVKSTIRRGLATLRGCLER